MHFRKAGHAAAPVPGLAACMVLFLFLFLFLPACSRESAEKNTSAETAMEKNTVCFSSHCFSVEIASTPEQRAEGLMYRSHLDADSGMLFVFPAEGDYPFWMKNTLIPLDIIWMDSQGEVVHIARDAQPCDSADCPNIEPGKNASYVLELNAGMAEKTGLKEGDSMALTAG
jgi:uncharacterized membrane protein (UPF0127 family)